MATVHAAIIGISSPVIDAPALRGVSEDVLGWQRQLSRMGVPPHRMHRVLGAAHSTAEVLEAVQAMAREVSLDPEAQGLLIIAGHGGEQDGTLLRCGDGPLRADQVAATLEALLPGRGITAIVDVCPVDAPAAGPLALRPCDLVMAGASPGHPAEELEVDGRWQGAFTWALHRVLDRWAHTGPHGALVPIAPRVLHAQACLVLQGLGFGQAPSLTGPSPVIEAPLVGASTSVRAPLPAQVTRQISPDTDCLVYDIQTTMGSSIGTLVVTGPDFVPSGNYIRSREYWTALPTTAFKLVPTTLGLPGTPPGIVYKHFAFDPAGGTSSYTLSAGAGQTLFTLSAGGTTVGYLMRTNGSPVGLSWYMTTSPITAYFPAPSTGLVFTPTGGSVSITAQNKASAV